MATALWQMWDRWSRPYITRLVDKAKAERPHVPLTLYALGSGGLVERLGTTGVDVVGLDYMIDMREARERLGPSMAVQVSRPCNCCMQGLLSFYLPAPPARVHAGDKLTGPAGLAQLLVPSSARVLRRPLRSLLRGAGSGQCGPHGAVCQRVCHR